jgi:hypothetical protein
MLKYMNVNAMLDHMKSCFENKLTTSTKMKYLGGLVCCGGEEGGFWGTCLVTGCVLRILLGMATQD